MPLCFAYGSNMDRSATAARCPGSRPLGPARLTRHRLAITREGYLTVVRDPRRTVHGLLWDVPLADMSALDRYEGAASRLYVKAQLRVLADDGPRAALVYLGRNDGPGVPRPGYLEVVVAAARDLQLPDDYVRDLAALSPTASRATPEAGLGRPAVTPRRRTPLDREPDRLAGWRWSP